ncbi:uncharacterized protein LOC132543922 [Ylistrum balloti]|uniref:uncharacterized protein LOC132543922 n=1 Tax=Ylistrum balloti TaxID=509963 RepID=UPI002905A461|nr:uncharacterized protein LOC132543922 [Ylistrum balloti]
MNSQLFFSFRCLKSYGRCINSVTRPNVRSLHKAGVHCQDGSKENPDMPEYMKKRYKLLESNPVKYSTGKAAKFSMTEVGFSSTNKPLHRNLSAVISLSVLFIYLMCREENDIDANISFDAKTAEEFQEYLDKLKARKGK